MKILQLAAAGAIALSLAAIPAAAASAKTGNGITVGWTGRGEITAGFTSSSWCISSAKSQITGPPERPVYPVVTLQPCHAHGFHQGWIVSFVRYRNALIGDVRLVANPGLCLFHGGPSGPTKAALLPCGEVNARTFPVSFKALRVGAPFNKTIWRISWQGNLTVSNPYKAGKVLFWSSPPKLGGKLSYTQYWDFQFVLEEIRVT